MFIHPSAPRRAAGFTLLEVIAAMALITLLIGGVYGIADGAIRLGTSMSRARLSETRLVNFTNAWRDYLETMPPGVRLSCGLEKATRGASGRLLIEGGSVPFAWTRQVRLADAVEFALVRGEEKGSLNLLVRHLKRLEKPTIMDAYEQICELPLLEGLKEFHWQFYDASEKRWYSSWDPDKHGGTPLFMRLRFQFLTEPREHEFTYWVANDLAAPAALTTAAPGAPPPPPAAAAPASAPRARTF